MRDKCIYIGLAGDTEPGRFLSSGLYRSIGFSGKWESLTHRFDQDAQVRCVLTNPVRPGQVTVGTQLGLFRSDDSGDHWHAISAPRPGRAVWSLVRLAGTPNTLIAGYEPCMLYRSVDDGDTWSELKAITCFPDISIGDDIPKRVTSIAGDPLDPRTWTANPLPRGVGHVFSMAIG
jgi:hypothetical protein